MMAHAHRVRIVDEGILRLIRHMNLQTLYAYGNEKITNELKDIFRSRGCNTYYKNVYNIVVVMINIKSKNTI